MQLTTLSPPAFIGDALLWLFLLWGIAEWPADQRQVAIYCLLGWMTFSKFIKLITHFIRYPVDILLWPVSILFGWFHGLIKVYALVTLSEVSSSHYQALQPKTDTNPDHMGKPSRCRRR